MKKLFVFLFLAIFALGFDASASTLSPSKNLLKQSCCASIVDIDLNASNVLNDSFVVGVDNYLLQSDVYAEHNEGFVIRNSKNQHKINISKNKFNGEYNLAKTLNFYYYLC
jgi:hypothetical protein